MGCGGSSDVVVAVIDTGLAFEDYTSVWNDIGSTKFDFDPAPDMLIDIFMDIAKKSMRSLKYIK